MQKYVPYIFIFVLFLVTCIAACGGGSSSVTPVTDYTLPTTFATYSSLPNTLRGGAVQKGLITTNAKFSNAKFSIFSASTVAGISGTTGIGFSNYTTPNGPPAKFNRPTDITTDGVDFYVTDYNNNRIRKVTTEGKVSTLPVIGLLHPSGITTDGTNLYVTDTGYNRIQVISIATGLITTTIGSTTGLAGSVDVTVVPPATTADITLARFNQPIGITTDGINLYVTDFNNSTVRRIEIATKAVYTLAGVSGATGSANGLPKDARFNRPGRITTDGKYLYVTDFYNRTIRRIEISTGTVTTIAGIAGKLGFDNGTSSGIGSAAHFYQPNGITTDGKNLYVTDSYHNTIRKVVISTGAVTTIPLPSDSLHTPIGLTTDGISLFVADTYIEHMNQVTHEITYTFSNSILRIQ